MYCIKDITLCNKISPDNGSVNLFKTRIPNLKSFSDLSLNND